MEQVSGRARAEFGRLLRQHRLAAGLTQEELAERTRMSVRALSDLERGRRQPRRSTVTALAAGLDLPGSCADAFLAAGRPRGGAVVPFPVVGCQVPAAPGDFTGRAAELELLGSVVAEGAATVSVVVGKPGAGKTTLAVRVAHHLVGRYPDAQLYLDLRGTAPVPTRPVDALAVLLRALGLTEQEIPADLDTRLGRYRSLTHDRSVLVVLDNAADEHQVRPLLPAGARCGAIVTSRQALLGLAATRRVTVGELTEREAVRLLDRIVGADRTGAEPSAAHALVRLCGQLPLALRIVGNRLASRPVWTVAALVDVLRDQHTRLGRLHGGDLAVRPAFEVSHAHLSDAGQALFAMLSLVPGPDFGAGAAASLAGVDADRAAATLVELADAHMVEPTERPGRYRFHDLLRLFATELLDEDTMCVARARWVSWLVTTATAAGAWLDPSRELRVTEAIVADRAHALAWLADEHATLLAFGGQAAQYGADAELLALAEGLPWYFDLSGRWEDWRLLNEHALAAARRSGDRGRIATTTNSLGVSLFCLRRVTAATELHRAALAVSREAGATAEEADALHFLGVDVAETGRVAEAMAYHHEALALARRMDNTWCQGRSLGKIADCLIILGRHAEAIEFTTLARAIAARLDDPRGEALGRARLGQASHGLGRFADAIGELTGSAESFGLLSDHWSEAWARYHLGLVLHDAGRCAAALGQYHRALALFERSGDRHWQNIVTRARSRTETVLPDVARGWPAG